MVQSYDWPAIFKRALSRGGWLAEVFYEDSRTLSLQMEDHRLEKSVAGRDAGLGLRVLFGERTAYGYTNDLSQANVLDLAGELSRLVEGQESEVSPSLDWAEPRERFAIVRPAESAELKAKAALVERASQAAWAHDQRVRQVKIVYGERSQEVFIANSQGLAVKDRRPYLVFMAQAVAAEGQVIQTGYQPVGGLVGLEIFDEQAPEEVALEAARQAVQMLEARPAPGGRMPVVLAGRAGGTMIHEAVGHGLEADLALEGLSVYGDKLGQEVASPLVTVLDDATLLSKRGSYGFDDEGSPAQRTVLIDQGRLSAYLTDRLYARKGGLPLSGNGRRESYRHRPITRMSNTLIAPGQSDPEEIVRATDKGLFVAKMGGGQVNTANGDFVFEVSEGYLIEDGRVGQPVRGATLVGNGPEVLRSIDLVGSDLGFGIGTCGKEGQGVPVADAQPTLRIPELLVGGAV